MVLLRHCVKRRVAGFEAMLPRSNAARLARWNERDVRGRQDLDRVELELCALLYSVYGKAEGNREFKDDVLEYVLELFEILLVDC